MPTYRSRHTVLKGGAALALATVAGLRHRPAVATLVGMLIEVPVMLSVVWIVNRSQGWHERGAAGKGAALMPASREV
ncbi:hypothetical protein MET9862_01777 [Methylobacterium symbioticum]|uniref:Uncharacterized protein n=1 Tax=Methylobacterium symbioticum TaxID=2584084 RepID=A0A509EAL4_9HYPH|nr:hypothetical protein MET9862_01777 [Methylobacterium symbioticum]